ncbi:MAG: DUF6588 family protein [Candidatus Krumholzibacteriia bacterium]
MPALVRYVKGLGLAVLALLAACPAGAQIGNQLSAYTGLNATGYLQPLADAFGADLNSGLYHSARIPSHPHLSVEVKVMSVMFDNEDRTFLATTEGLFDPPQTVQAPTIVGSGAVVTVPGTGGTTFAFPGGFDLSSFAIAVPQVRFGAFAGTEGVIRFFAVDTGDVELGDIKLFGFGVRHSFSQYFGPLFPLDLSGGFFWQSFEMGGDLVDTKAFSIGLQASKDMVLLQPYAGVSWDRFSLDVLYESDALGAPQTIDLAFESESSLHLTVGLGLNLAILNVHGEYNIAEQSGFAFGLAIGN